MYYAPFQPIRNSSAPAFNSTSGSSGLYALEATGTREFQFPSNRVIRLASIAGDDVYFMLGTSDIVVGSTNGTLLLGNTVEIFRVQSGQTHIAFKSSTDVTVNVTLGTGVP